MFTHNSISYFFLCRRCVAVYEESVKNLSTERMWTLYLETLLELNKDQSQLPNFKRKLLLAAFQGGHDVGKLTENQYLIWVSEKFFFSIKVPSWLIRSCIHIFITINCTQV